MSDPLAVAMPISSPELEALGDRIASQVEEAVEATIRGLRADYAEPLLTLLGDVPECLAPPDEAREIPVPAGDSETDRQQYVCAVEGTKQSLVERLRELLDDPSLQATEPLIDETVDALRRDLDGIAADLPSLAEAEQEDRHFYAEPIEPRRITAVKALKRVVRPMRRRWIRSVPVAGVARWAGAMLFEEVAPVITDLRRLRIRVLAAAVQDFHASLAITDQWRNAALGARSDSVAGTSQSNGVSSPSRDRGTPHHDRDDVVAVSRQRRADFQTDLAAAEASLRGAAARVGDRLVAALTVIGTVERSASTVDESRVARRYARIDTRCNARAARWRVYEQGLVSALRTDGEFVELSAALADVIGNAIGEVQETTAVRVREPLAHLERVLRDAEQRLAAVFDAGVDEAAALDALSSDIAAEFGIVGARARADTDIGSAVREHIEAVLANAAALPERVREGRLLAPFPVDEVPVDPPGPAIREAPLRRLAQFFTTERLTRELHTVLGSTEAEHFALGQELERLEQAITFNLKSANGGLADGRPGAREAARDLSTGVLQRSARRLAELQRASVALDATVAQGLRSRAMAILDEMQSLVRSRDAGAMQAALLKSEAATRLAERMEASRRAGAAAAVQVRGTATRAWERIIEAQRWIGRRIGLVAADRAEARVSLQRAVFDERVSADLPLAYRQLFTTEPLQWTDFTIGREMELATIERARADWQAGRPASVALFGEQGSGKTSLLLAAQQRFFTADRVRTLALTSAMREPDALREALSSLFEIDEPLPLRELATRVRRGEPTIAIVEHGEYLFLRRIGGFQLLDEFLALVHATSARVLWMMTMEQYAWRFLERTVQVHDSFVHDLPTTTLTVSNLREAILRRHQMSGYGMRFDPDPRLERSRRYKHLASERTRQEVAQQSYFDALGRIADGNVNVALYYWLRSIRSVGDDALVLGTPAMIEMGYLETMSLPALHTVAAIIQHGGLSAGEHAEVFARPVHESERLLWSLADGSILTQDDGGHYALNRALYRPFVRLLRDRNILA